MAATNPIKLCVNRQTKQLVQFGASLTTLPDFYQSDKPDFELQIVDPTGSPSSPFTALDFTGHGLRVAIGDQPKGTGGPIPFVLYTAATWDATKLKFYGQLDLTTADLTTFLGSLDTKKACFEIHTTLSSDRTSLYQNKGANVNAVLDSGTTNTPTPVDSYPTWNELKAYAVPLDGLAGQVVESLSPDGHYRLLISVGNDGIRHEEIQFIP